MNFTNQLAELFVSPQGQVTTESLDFSEYTFTCSGVRPDFKKEFEQKLSDLLPGDDLLLTLSIDDEPHSFEKSRNSNDRFWQFFETISTGTSQSIKVSITITKGKNDQGIIRLYSFESFCQYLYRLDLKTFLEVFNSKLSDECRKIIFLSEEITGPFHTESIFFIKGTHELSSTGPDLERSAFLAKVQSISYFTGLSSCRLLPQDFYFETKQNIPDQFYEKFSAACFVLLFAYINDFAFIDRNTLDLKLNGYKTLTTKLDAAQFPYDSINRYFSIYKWSIQHGSLNDKIGLIRNILSLNINQSHNYAIDDSVFTSILSGYKVYEKQNVKQYIELRNKMSDQLLGFNEKASKIIENFASGFQKSALAFVSLFSSIIVIRVLSGHDFVNIFTPDATVLSLAFLFISFLYYRASLWELKEQRKRFVESYENMKTRNEDLLTKDDIQRILNDDKEYKTDLKFIEDKKKQYSRVWLLFIITFVGIVLLLYTFYSVTSLQQIRIIGWLVGHC